MRISSQDPFSENDSIKGDSTFINDNYYKCNYIVYSEEKLAEINAINNLISFTEMTDIELSEQHLQQLKERIRINTSQYNNYLRDMRLNFNFNSYFLDFEEAFDVMIKFNPEWLDIPQLSIEYYFDEDGKVVKRTKEELEEKLKAETNDDTKKYIQHILKYNNNKRLSNYVFSSDGKSIKDENKVSK